MFFAFEEDAAIGVLKTSQSGRKFGEYVIKKMLWNKKSWKSNTEEKIFNALLQIAIGITFWSVDIEVIVRSIC